MLRGWLYNGKGKLTVARIPKAASTAIEGWLGRDFRQVSSEEAMEAEARVAFIRDPIERAKSAYSHMYYLKAHHTEHDCKAPVDSWENFVDYILVNDNNHWRPQHLLIGDVPTVIHRLENLGAVRDRYWPGILKPDNCCSRLPTSDYRTDELLEMYMGDLRLRAIA